VVGGRLYGGFIVLGLYSLAHYADDMTEKRRYDSTRRREQARATRREILDAAGRLFVGSGYAATTLTAVAAEAGVSVQTVYATFTSKRQLLSDLVDTTIAGDDEEVSLPERPFVAEIRALPDARDKLARYATHLAEVHAREADVMIALAGAATADEDAAAIWRKNRDDRRAGMVLFAADLAATGAVRPDVTAEQVADVLWLAMDFRAYDWLVRERGWPVARYVDWYVTSVAGSVLTPTRARRAAR
jgi:TetR/AcrR family transcriptional regulator, regulator of autoinduction and epiphytic fitness